MNFDAWLASAVLAWIGVSAGIHAAFEAKYRRLWYLVCVLFCAPLMSRLWIVAVL